MLWKRLSLTKKIFFAIALTSTLIVLVMAVLIGLSMRAGFVRYLLEAEMERFDILEEALAKTHDAATPGWPELVAHPPTWHNFIRDNVAPARPRAALMGNQIPPRRLPPRGPGRSPRRNGAPPGLPDPLRLAERISLLNAAGQVVIGPNEGGAHFAIRPIMPIDVPIDVPIDDDAAETADPLGWIGLSAPADAPIAMNSVFLRDQLWWLVIVSIIALVISALAALILARQFLAPVKVLADGANALADGNYAARMENDREDELGTLINHFNALAKSLEAARNAERQWITDTSHELQTPLAVLRAEIEALQDDVRQPTPEVLAGLHASVMRLSHLVGDLNTLSRTRECGFSFSLDDIDLREVIVESLDHARSGIEQAGLTLTAHLDEALPVTCDRHRMHQLLDNLLENARRYTEAPGEIVLVAKRDGDTVNVTIDDTKPCPPDRAIERLFERFFRLEASRSREHGGSGLGLAICQAIVEAHGGTIEARASGLGGLQMTIRLPIRADNEDAGHAKTRP